MGLQAVPRLPQVVFAVLSGQAPREGDKVNVSVLVDPLHLLPLCSHFPEVVAHPAQGRGEQNKQGDAQEVEEDAGSGGGNSRRAGGRTTARQEAQVNKNDKNTLMSCQRAVSNSVVASSGKNIYCYHVHS